MDSPLFNVSPIAIAFGLLVAVWFAFLAAYLWSVLRWHFGEGRRIQRELYELDNLFIGWRRRS